MLSQETNGSIVKNHYQPEHQKKYQQSKQQQHDLTELLKKACINGDIENVKLLLSNKSVPIKSDQEGRTVLHYASAIGNAQIVKLIIESGVNVNALDLCGYSSVHHASTKGHISVLKLLIKHGADINIQDKMHGNTALHEASWKGYSATIEILCKNKANMYIKNKNGNTALHLTCQQGHNQSCRNLLLYGCKPDLKNDYGDSPLHTAARYGHAGVVRILISAHCNINDVNKNGDSALHISSAMGRRKLTKILLESGCDVTIKNKQGETAMDIALRKSFNEVQHIIANRPVVRKRDHALNNNNNKNKNNNNNNKYKTEKESSLVSRGSSKHKGRYKKNVKNCKTRKMVTFPHNSPYGCPLSPELEHFPRPKIDSLPPEPLLKGEQYYLDLAGNIRKGPIGRVFNCYCVPLINQVEKKMESNKQELKKHIDYCRVNLDEKICSLEKKTCHGLRSLNDAVKSKFNIDNTDFPNTIQREAEEKRLSNNIDTNKIEVHEYRKSLQMKSLLNSSENSKSLNNIKNLGLRVTSAENISYPRKGYFNNNNIINHRSRSETHLAASDSEESTCLPNGHLIKAEVYTNADSDKAELSELKDECNVNTVRTLDTVNNESSLDHHHHHHHHQQHYSHLHQHNQISVEPITDLMKSLQCNTGDFRKSPLSDSGYRTKSSPSPREPLDETTAECFEKSVHLEKDDKTINFDKNINGYKDNIITGDDYYHKETDFCLNKPINYNNIDIIPSHSHPNHSSSPSISPISVLERFSQSAYPEHDQAKQIDNTVTELKISYNMCDSYLLSSKCSQSNAQNVHHGMAYARYQPPTDPPIGLPVPSHALKPLPADPISIKSINNIQRNSHNKTLKSSLV